MNTFLTPPTLYYQPTTNNSNGLLGDVSMLAHLSHITYFHFVIAFPQYILP